MLLVPVLLGILLMHGGLSVHADHHDRHDHPGAFCGSDGPLDAAGSRPSAPHSGASHQRSIPGHPASFEGASATLAAAPLADHHGGHVGELCLAFLRVTGILLAALLLARAVRKAVSARVRSRLAHGRPERPLLGGLPRLRAPSLARLCVLRV
ncbi:hypothetical protein ND748_08900 [Frankia sp. AiPs1]|uniref:hypothetical protein n=1 Tax=Frankia sp. AiPs1 TaxID=573493 RepID=UPI0020447791|nr:hypothetical protein [Frankia sp. AiPs1]MCM3921778.1 hypothetical protein [Frankia sp. AiPs1]